MNPPMRRSMSAALRTPELSPEALALIKEGTPRPVVEKPVVVAPVERSEEVLRPPVMELVADPVDETPKPVRPRGTPTRELDPMPLGGVAHLSVRLPAEIPQALLRASLDRKLKRLKPWTQQDIVAEAVMQWLKRNGCLDA